MLSNECRLNSCIASSVFPDSIFEISRISSINDSKDLADEVIVKFVAEEGAEPMEQKFQSQSDAREDEAIQSAIVKMIERSEAKTVISSVDIELKSL